MSQDDRETYENHIKIAKALQQTCLELLREIRTTGDTEAQAKLLQQVIAGIEKATKLERDSRSALSKLGTLPPALTCPSH